MPSVLLANVRDVWLALPERSGSSTARVCVARASAPRVREAAIVTGGAWPLASVTASDNESRCSEPLDARAALSAAA